ncbi:glucose-6-phosphate isomerase [Zhongshania aliphaticivorans]|uniref:glucose-6-phosphate isomerase n=1 Tax=Zhongshania aliphaticivorans TaxID=1470434 RepID=UPI0012E494CC|nr:glucose-6-phosphate isomerase [Zhongshania aliphaticivorans]CAA0116456.1 Glucose-6-phosphate isomerase [Zhongshania aliphaticivorans]
MSSTSDCGTTSPYGINTRSTLLTLAQRSVSTPLSQRFQDDPTRAERYSADIGPLFVDYSKHHIDSNILDTLCTLARNRGVAPQLAALRAGAHLNNTENRATNYPSLRLWASKQQSGDSTIDSMYSNMAALVNDIHDGKLRGQTDKVFTDLVNIGIGGSDFGPRLICDALSNQGEPLLKTHFAANIDPSVISEILATVPAETTLFIVASKSFGTQETRSNATTARRWLCSELKCDDVDQHFVAVTSKPESAKTFGIREDLIISVPEWVGGRFSVWSGFGLAVALSAGMENFRAFLHGGYEVDQYVEHSPLESNAPIILGLLDVWYRNAWGISSQAVLPYEHRLKLLPIYLQQLFMESAGKSVSSTGEILQHGTGGVIWGTEGTNGQHSFHQLLHQGSDTIPCDFIACLHTYNPIGEQHQNLIANCFSQSLVLMQGQSAPEIERALISNGMATADAKRLAQHKAILGNRPSTTILMDQLTPKALGALIALYEYRLFAASFVWGINPFDQWGVELGKQISQTLMGALSGNEAPELDSSTAQLIARYKQAQQA